MPFNSLGLDPRIAQAVREAGYTEPTPIQAAAIPVILTGQDVTGIAQTGTGKTAAFTLPLLTRMMMTEETAATATALPSGSSATSPGKPAASGSRRRFTRALVLAPTRELAVQIEENVRIYSRHLPLKTATVFGGVGERPQIEALRAGTDLIIACPGRLLDLMGQGHGDFSRLSALVLDEADRMLDMGFLPSIRRILRTLPTGRQTLLFSATLSREIEALTSEFQRHPRTVQIGRRSNPAETVAQWVYEVPAHHKPGLLLHLLADPAMNSVLVFTRTKHGADRIARRLEAQAIPCGTLHANRSQNQRLRALKDFRSGAVRVLVATDIAARGIDVDGISHVVNYDFPPHAEDYVHRIGRTGRAQAVGDAISFVSGEDAPALRTLEKFIGRGILRRKAEGFDLTAPPPPKPPAPQRPARQPRSGNGAGPTGRPPRSGGGGQPGTPRPRAEQDVRSSPQRIPGSRPPKASSPGPGPVRGRGQPRPPSESRPAGRDSADSRPPGSVPGLGLNWNPSPPGGEDASRPPRSRRGGRRGGRGF